MDKIVKFEHFKRIEANTSCGTGYSEPDIWLVTLEDGTQRKVTIDIWYCPADFLKKQFKEGMSWAGFSDYNVDEAFELYINEICDGKCCPYTKEEIFNENNNNFCNG